MECKGYGLSDYTSEGGGVISQFTHKFRTLCLHYKEKGFLEFCKRVCIRSVMYGKFAVFEGDLSKPVEEVHAKIPINIRALLMDEADIGRLVKF
jgi:hypothetical protein